MIRILAAVFIAVSLHLLLFSMKPEWLESLDRKKEKPAISITMSYKKKNPLPVIKSPEKEKEEKRVKIPAKVNIPVQDAIIEQKETENKEIFEQETANVEEGIEEPAFEDTGADDEFVKKPVAAVVITEAVPVYKENPEPAYPRIAKKRGYEGTVLLSVLVNKNGLVDNIWIFESCGYTILDNAALDAVKDWIFEPGRSGDEPIEMWVEVPVRFEIE